MKKNWMMVDTKSGAYVTAYMYSIVETAKANNLKIYEYLTYVLEETSKCMKEMNTEIPERLMPWSDELLDHVPKNIRLMLQYLWTGNNPNLKYILFFKSTRYTAFTMKTFL